MNKICFQTDDKGVFRTTLSNEFEIVASHFNLEKSKLKEISMSSVKYSFARDEEKNFLKKIIENFD